MNYQYHKIFSHAQRELQVLIIISVPSILRYGLAVWAFASYFWEIQTLARIVSHTT